MFQILINALRETLIMVCAASVATLLIGIPLGILVAQSANSTNKLIKGVYYLFSSTIELAKIVPYVLIMILFIPLSNFLIRHGISYTSATIIPLATAGRFLLARSVFKIIFDLTGQWNSTAKSMGATPIQTLRFIVLPESMPEIIRVSAHSCGLIVTFSAIAGALGAGGLGQLAIEKSIHEPNPMIVLLSILMVVVMQQLIEYTGTLVVQQTQPR